MKNGQIPHVASLFLKAKVRPISRIQTPSFFDQFKSIRISSPERRLDMGKDNDLKARIADLHERMNFLVLLVQEYNERLKFNDLRDNKLDNSINQLRTLRAQIDSIEATLAEIEAKPDV